MVGEEFEDYQEDLEEDEFESNVEKQKDAQEMVYDDTPTYEKKDDLYSLFWKVVQTRDSSKVGNLSKPELGILNLTVRDCQKIALLGDKLGHEEFAKFFLAQGEITLSTSASKDGWLPELFVSQRKVQTKKRESNLPQLQPKKRKGLFGEKG